MNSFVKNNTVKFLLFVCMLINVFSVNVFAVNTNDFYIRDSVGCISNEIKEYVSKINNYYESTKEKPQIVVEIVESLNGERIESYALNRFEDLQLGNKEMDNGVLLVISTGDKKNRIEVGYGLEGALTDSESKEILDSSIEYFRAENYSMAVKNIFNGIVAQINGEYGYLDIEELDSFGGVQEDYITKEFQRLTNTEKFIYAALLITFIYFFVRYDWFRKYIAYVCMEFLELNGRSRGINSSKSFKGSFGHGGRSGGGGSSSSW